MREPLGSYIADVMEGRPCLALRAGGRFEAILYRSCGVDAGEEMSWKRCRIDAVCRTAQRQFAQCQQIGFTEEALGGRAYLLGDVHLAGLEACDEVIGRQIDEFDSSASSNIRSGIVSCCRTPVMPANTSFRLSRC